MQKEIKKQALERGKGNVEDKLRTLLIIKNKNQNTLYVVLIINQNI
mgnify:CR=1 FL=1